MSQTFTSSHAGEHLLKDGDFIVSKTDLQGRITYGNRTFAEYAGYAERDFLGKQHNLVRHPDMPRAVFKLLWDRIQAGQEVFAYVKNRCQDGSFYWVFANVTPSYDVHGQLIGYYSVRRKPNPKAVQAITGVYQRMRQIEQQAASAKEGMADSLAWVLDHLKGQGSDYDTFIFGLQKL